MSADNDLLWLSVSDLGRRKGVTKQAIGKRLARLEAQGLIETRQGPRGTKLVNLAAFDYAVGASADAIRAMNGASAQPFAGMNYDPVLAREQARRTAYQADIARLDLKARLAKLVPAAEVKAAVEACAARLFERLETLLDEADRLAESIGANGVTGARACLKVIARELRAAIAEDMAALAVGAPDDGALGEGALGEGALSLAERTSH